MVEKVQVTLEVAKLNLEELLRIHQTQLQEFADMVAAQYGVVDTPTHQIMLDLSGRALCHKEYTGRVLKEITKISMIRQVPPVH